MQQIICTCHCDLYYKNEYMAVLGLYIERTFAFDTYGCLPAAGISAAGEQNGGHFSPLYSVKDQALNGIESGHRHDWEYTAVWTVNG